MNEFERTHPTWKDDVNWDAYVKTWIPLNESFIKQAQQRLPMFNRRDPVIYYPGAGTAIEMAHFHSFYPGARFITSDITSDTVDAVRENHDRMNVTPRFFVEDAEHPAVDEVDMCVNVFMLHLLNDPPTAMRRMWRGLRPGGWFMSLYFPPVPTGDGPLAALFWAVADTLAGKTKPNWEQDALPWLMSTAKRLTSAAFYVQWSFESLEDFRASMELLPHIRALEVKLGRERYETVWSRWRDRPGMYPDQSKGWHGTVAARFLLAQKS